MHPGIVDWIKEKGDFDESRVAEVDYNDPLIGMDIQEPSAKEPHVITIDGFHRIIKATREGVFTLPFWYITKAIADEFFSLKPENLGPMPEWGKTHETDKLVAHAFIKNKSKRKR